MSQKQTSTDIDELIDLIFLNNDFYLIKLPFYSRSTLVCYPNLFAPNIPDQINREMTGI